MSDSYYAPPEAINGNSFVLTGSEAHHAATVIRIKSGDTLELFDGLGNRYTGTASSAAPDEVSGTITGTIPGNEPALRITLACALIKQERFEWMLEKAVELGVGEIRPLITARTIIKLPAAKTEKRLMRWRNQILAAVKQSRRSRIPEIYPPVALNTLDLTEYERILIPCMREHANGVPRSGKGRTIVFIGPEGGFTETEIEAVTGTGGIPVTLGQRRLRTETAALAVLRDLLTVPCE